MDDVLHHELDALRDDQKRLTDFCLGSELPEVLTFLRRLPTPHPRHRQQLVGRFKTEDGVFTAGSSGGQFTVRGGVCDKEAIADVRVRSEQSNPVGSVSVGYSSTQPILPGKRVLQWRRSAP